MALFTVDSNKCQSHGHCVGVCPVHIIEQTDQNAVPSLLDGMEDFCIRCGHCVAVCPEGAFSLEFMSPDQCGPLNREAMPGAEQVRALFENRRSIRNYKSDPVDKGVLENLFGLACFAPSGKNVQPVRWMVLTGDNIKTAVGHVLDWVKIVIRDQPDIATAEGLHALINAVDVGKDMICHSAPAVAIAYGDADDRRTNPASLIALAHLELAAPALGLGACWSGYLTYVANYHEPLAKFFGLPKGNQVFGAMTLGYPEMEFKRIPLRNVPSVEWK